MPEPLPDDAPLTRQLAAAASAAAVDARRRAREAAGRQVGKARAATARRARHLWSETRLHRRSAWLAATLTAAGLWLASEGRVVALLAAWALLTVGAPVAYMVAYAWKRSQFDDRESFERRKRGRHAQSIARQAAFGVAVAAVWLATVGTVGLHVDTWPGTFLLAWELFGACLAARVAYFWHWSALWRRHHPVFETPPTPAADAPAAAVEPDAADTPTDPGDAIGAVLVKHSVDAAVTGMVQGPMVTRYELTLGSTGSVDDVTNRARDIAYALKTPDVRIMSPIPGQSLVGVEVPRAEREFVTLAEALAAIGPDAHPLTVCLGRSVEGGYVVTNIADWPHAAVGGATGAGKSSTINAVLCTILTRATPAQVQLLLVDPKRVELISYRRAPHLVRPIVVEPDDAGAALEWVKQEMLGRYELFADAEVEKIDEYNAEMDRTGGVRLPYLLVVIDELADLMMVAADDRRRRRGQEDDDMPDTERLIIRIGQLARAAGIHLLLATQRPSVDVVTGRIKANVPTRLAHATASLTDSRVILDQPGAEKLTGKGDGLFLSADSSVPIRFQAAHATKPEVKAIVAAAVERFGAFEPPPAVATPVAAPVFAAPRPVEVSPADLVLAIVASAPGCSTADITNHPVWVGRKQLSQSQMSRTIGPLVTAGLLSRVQDGKAHVDYRVLEPGVRRAEAAAAALGLDVQVAA